jgi:hypothetical protein
MLRFHAFSHEQSMKTKNTRKNKKLAIVMQEHRQLSKRDSMKDNEQLDKPAENF